MESGQSYILRAFCDQQEVITSAVAVVPGGNSYPQVGQAIDSKWKVLEILDSPQGEYRIRVTRV